MALSEPEHDPDERYPCYRLDSLDGRQCDQAVAGMESQAKPRSRGNL